MTFDTLELPVKSKRTPKAMIRRPGLIVSTMNLSQECGRTMLCREIAILLANVLEVPGCGVEDLDIACHVFFAPNFTKIVKTEFLNQFGHS